MEMKLLLIQCAFSFKVEMNDRSFNVHLTLMTVDQQRD